jgi:hypothetical protein
MLGLRVGWMEEGLAVVESEGLFVVGPRVGDELTGLLELVFSGFVESSSKSSSSTSVGAGSMADGKSSSSVLLAGIGLLLGILAGGDGFDGCWCLFWFFMCLFMCCL